MAILTDYDPLAGFKIDCGKNLEEFKLAPVRETWPTIHDRLMRLALYWDLPFRPSLVIGDGAPKVYMLSDRGEGSFMVEPGWEK